MLGENTLLTPINHWCFSEELMEQSFSCITHLVSTHHFLFPLVMSERDTGLPVRAQQSPIICLIQSFLWHSTWSTAITTIAMPSLLLLYAAFGGIYQDMGLAPAEVLKSQLVTSQMAPEVKAQLYAL